VVPDRATVPIPWSMVTDVAPLTFHRSSVDCPAVITPGTALNDVITGVPVGTIDIVAVAVTGLPPFDAVSIYVLLSDGDTLRVPDVLTVPTPWLIVTTVAPVTAHCRVEDCPALIAPGVAVKDPITGALDWEL
jgi:hypothetical protein